MQENRRDMFGPVRVQRSRYYRGCSYEQNQLDAIPLRCTGCGCVALVTNRFPVGLFKCLDCRRTEALAS